MGWFFSQAIASQIDQLPYSACRRSKGWKHRWAIQYREDTYGAYQLHQHQAVANYNAAKLFGVATNAVEVVGAIVVMTFLGLYFAAEANLYISGLVRSVPHGRRVRCAEILHETASAIWYWMLGRLVSMTTLGFLVAIGLWIIGVPLPVALGFLAGILTFVPYIAALVSAIPSLLLAFPSILSWRYMWSGSILLFISSRVTSSYRLCNDGYGICPRR